MAKYNVKYREGDRVLIPATILRPEILDSEVCYKIKESELMVPQRIIAGQQMQLEEKGLDTVNEITTHRKEIYEFPEYEDSILQVSFSAPSWLGREKQHLVEEKIDKLFDEAKEIITSSVYHTA